MLATTLLLTLLSVEPTAPAGAVVAPAALPAGTIAMYAQVGAPDVGVGYRQGFAPLEFEARALFNVFQVSGLVDVGVRVPVLTHDRLMLSAGGSLGLLFNSGARYFDTANFPSVALRPRLLGTLGIDFSELVTGLAQLEIPLALSLTVVGTQFSPTVGAGAEIHLGGRLSLLVMGQIGVDATKEPLGVTQVRPAWAVRLGLGYRMF